MKNLLCKRLPCLLLLLITFVFSAKIFAFEVVLQEQQINDLLAVSFPINQQYQGVDIHLSDPKVKLMVSNQELMIKLVATATQNGQKLRAITGASGQIKFDKSRNAIQIIEPRLTEFKVLDNTIDQSDDIIKSVKQAVGQQMPAIFFIDLNQLNQLIPGLQPKNISISSRGLVITI